MRIVMIASSIFLLIKHILFDWLRSRLLTVGIFDVRIICALLYYRFMNCFHRGGISQLISTSRIWTYILNVSLLFNLFYMNHGTLVYTNKIVHLNENILPWIFCFKKLELWLLFMADHTNVVKLLSVHTFNQSLEE